MKDTMFDIWYVTYAPRPLPEFFHPVRIRRKSAICAWIQIQEIESSNKYPNSPMPSLISALSTLNFLETWKLHFHKKILVVVTFT